MTEHWAGDVQVRRTIGELLADPHLGHPGREFYRVDWWPERPDDTDDLGDDVLEVVMLVEDWEPVDPDDVNHELAALSSRWRDTPVARVAGHEDSDATFVRTGPFDSALAAFCGDLDPWELPEPDLTRWHPDDVRFLADVADERTRRLVGYTLNAALRPVYEPRGDAYLDSVPTAFPDLDFVLGTSAEPPLHDVAFCVLAARPDDAGVRPAN